MSATAKSVTTKLRTSSRKDTERRPKQRHHNVAFLTDAKVAHERWVSKRLDIPVPASAEAYRFTLDLHGVTVYRVASSMMALWEAPRRLGGPSTWRFDDPWREFAVLQADLSMESAIADLFHGLDSPHPGPRDFSIGSAQIRRGTLFDLTSPAALSFLRNRIGGIFATLHQDPTLSFDLRLSQAIARWAYEQVEDADGPPKFDGIAYISRMGTVRVALFPERVELDPLSVQPLHGLSGHQGHQSH